MPFGSQLNASLGSQGALAVLGDLNAAVVAAGTTQATATAIGTVNSIVTTTGFKAGVRLPVTPTVSANDRLHIANFGANDLAVYPPSGGKLNNNTANVPLILAQKKSADFFCINGTDYSVVIGG